MAHQGSLGRAGSGDGRARVFCHAHFPQAGKRRDVLFPEPEGGQVRAWRSGGVGGARGATEDPEPSSPAGAARDRCGSLEGCVCAHRIAAEVLSASPAAKEERWAGAERRGPRSSLISMTTSLSARRGTQSRCSRGAAQHTSRLAHVRLPPLCTCSAWPGSPARREAGRTAGRGKGGPGCRIDHHPSRAGLSTPRPNSLPACWPSLGGGGGGGAWLGDVRDPSGCSWVIPPSCLTCLQGWELWPSAVPSCPLARGQSQQTPILTASWPKVEQEGMQPREKRVWILLGIPLQDTAPPPPPSKSGPGVPSCSAPLQVELERRMGQGTSATNTLFQGWGSSAEGGPGENSVEKGDGESPPWQAGGGGGGGSPDSSRAGLSFYLDIFPAGWKKFRDNFLMKKKLIQCSQKVNRSGWAIPPSSSRPAASLDRH